MTGEPQPQNSLSPDDDLARAFARCFLCADGRRVIDHLRQVTLERVIGPAASDSLLRHTEGQRQLVARMLALIERGQNTAIDDPNNHEGMQDV